MERNGKGNKIYDFFCVLLEGYPRKLYSSVSFT